MRLIKLVARAACAGLWLSTAWLAGAQPSPPSAPDRATILKAAREVMVKARYCDLVTIGPGGQPQARPVDPFPPEDGLTVWIATNPATRKVGEIRADARVTLMYLDPAGDDYQLIRVAPSRIEVVSGAHGIANDPQTWRPVSVDLP